ncbi:MAG: DUF2807 domain-containing protein [Bacteroidales bacterium]|nr:DUF2807 domain-containing protein [Bacteroidales bacterium]
MINLIDNTFKVLTVSVALCVSIFLGTNLSAQTKALDHQNCPEFDAIEVSDEFQVVVRPAEKYSYTVTVDDALEPYCTNYIRNKTLYVTIDRKAIPKETKKLYQGKGGQVAILKVVVNMPVLRSVNLSGKAVMSVEGDITSERSEISLSDNSSLRGLDLASSDVTIRMEGKSSASVNIDSPAINVSTTGSSTLTLKQTSRELQLTPSRSSHLIVSGEMENVEVTSSGSSETILSGKGKLVNITGSNSSKVNAIDFACDDAIVSLANSAVAQEAAEDTLKVKLEGGSKLYFKGQPLFDIVRIAGSSLLPYTEMK